MHRHLEKSLKEHFNTYKQVLVLLGSRQVGKTTLIKKIFPQDNYFLIDNEPIRQIFESYDVETYKTIINSDCEYIIIDEIHLLSDPGRAAKIIFDQMSDFKLIITGSSSFHIKNKTGESLAGRKIDYYLYPLTFSEYLFQKGIEKKSNFNIFKNITDINIFPLEKKYKFDMGKILENVLLYGLYPHFVDYPKDKKYLLNFVDSLIFKDILELNLIENKKLAKDLLKLLASQIGNLINYSELANSLKADQRTIKRYIEIFEQSYIIFRLYPYSKNKRDEILKAPKIYFYDLGLRNAIINDFSEINFRADKGALFESFIISEIIKQNNYLEEDYNLYYWRTKQGSEIDLVLEKNKQIIGVETKYNSRSTNKSFKNRYPEAIAKNINIKNFY